MRGGRFEPRRTGLSVAAGLYVGVQPVFGLHLPLCLAICLPLKLDALIAYAAANISNPVLAGLIVFAEVQIGSLVLDAKWLPLTIAQVKQPHWSHLALQTAVGAQLLGVALAVLGGVFAARLARFALTRSERKQLVAATPDLSSAVVRTVRRYRAAASAHRNYVACKLRWDPLTRLIHGLPVQWGAVLDVGCGRGQLGLLLVELGRVRSLHGLDWDEQKIQVARQAAGSDAEFEVADLATTSLSGCDTALLIDVLHYFAPHEQSVLLTQIRQRLVTGGTLVLRDVDASLTWRSRVTRWFEMLGTRLRMNRGRRLYFQSAAELQKQLIEVGFTITETIPMPGFSLDNVLVVARKL